MNKIAIEELQEVIKIVNAALRYYDSLGDEIRECQSKELTRMQGIAVNLRLILESKKRHRNQGRA